MNQRPRRYHIKTTFYCLKTGNFDFLLATFRSCLTKSEKMIAKRYPKFSIFAAIVLVFLLGFWLTRRLNYRFPKMKKILKVMKIKRCFYKKQCPQISKSHSSSSGLEKFPGPAPGFNNFENAPRLLLIFLTFPSPSCSNEATPPIGKFPWSMN